MFSKTKIISNRRSASIVIKFDESKGVSEINLPIGLSNIPDIYELKKELFFQTYHTYRKFIKEKKLNIENKSSSLSNKQIQEEDMVYDDHEKFQFKDGMTGEVITYQKLVMFDSILDAYDEFKIQALQDKISKTNTIDYSKVHRYLHQAIFLSPDNDIFIDEIDHPRKTIRDATTEIVEMFCYIYSEILKEFGSGFDNHKVAVLANNFKENRLYEESSLFAEDTYEDTIEILKEVLEEIDRLTPYKDFDYWHFYDAIYNFIYSNNNGSWSLDNFSYIWERMCLAFAQKYYFNQIALYDDFGQLKSVDKYQPIINCYKISLNPKESKNIVRFIRPDLVMKDTNYYLDEKFLETIYNIVKKESEVDISYNKEVDIRNYAEVDKLKREEFKNKPRIKKFYQNTNRYPPVFTISFDEYNAFKEKAKMLLMKKGFFELSCRRPSIVKMGNAIDQYNNYLVVDFKYMGEEAFGENIDTQIQKTVIKQLVYEHTLKLNLRARTWSEFWIPAYIDSKYEDVPKLIRRYSKNCDHFFQKNRISVIQLDFLTLQQIYIQDAV
jgi:hypothetical protein